MKHVVFFGLFALALGICVAATVARKVEPTWNERNNAYACDVESHWGDMLFDICTKQEIDARQRCRPADPDWHIEARCSQVRGRPDIDELAAINARRKGEKP